MTARSPRDFSVFAFGSTHDALAAESALRDAGLLAVAIPAPRALGSLCGIALRLEPGDAERALGFLAEAGLEVTGRATISDV